MRTRSSFVGALILRSAKEFFEPLVRLFRVRVVQVVAGNIPLIVIGYVIINMTLRSPEMIYRTDTGETKRVELPDGNSVVLSADTLLRVHPSSGQLTIQLLKGEARFATRRADRTSFLVRTDKAEVSAHGGIFAVHRNEKGSTEVRVSEGTASVEPGRVAVTAGNTAEIAADGIWLRRSEAGDGAWREGRLLEFHGEPLLEVVADLNRNNKLQIVVDDPAIAERQIGGAFHATDPKGFAEALTHMGIRARYVETRSGGEIHLSGLGH